MNSIKSILLYSLSIISFLFIQCEVAFGQDTHAQRTYKITDYGAIPDGKTLNTKAIQSAIDAANAAKGGKVIFPKGKFLTGSIEMKSDVDLYLEEGAVLLGSTNPNDYKAMDTKGRPVSPKVMTTLNWH